MRFYFSVYLTDNLIMIEKLVVGETWTWDIQILSPDAPILNVSLFKTPWDYLFW